MKIIEHTKLYTIPCDCNTELIMDREEISLSYDYKIDLYYIECPKCGRPIIISPEELYKFHTNNKITIKNVK